MTLIHRLPSNPTDPHAVLGSDALPEPARVWLREAAASVAVRPNAIRVLFPAARRRCGQERLDAHWSVDEAARAVLLAALPYRGETLAGQVAVLFRHGDPAEQRAVLKALPFLDTPTGDAPFEDAPTGGAPARGGRAADFPAQHARAERAPSSDAAPFGDFVLSLVREALHGDDVSVVATALGSRVAARLSAAEYRQAVLRCVRHEIPLAAVAGLDARADRELARLLADFAHERIAAGREVPADVRAIVDAFPEVADPFAERTRAREPRPEEV